MDRWHKQREEARRTFNQSHLPNTPLNWHIWKRAFEAGWAYAGIVNDENKMSKENWKVFDLKIGEQMTVDGKLITRKENGWEAGDDFIENPESDQFIDLGDKRVVDLNWVRKEWVDKVDLGLK